MNLTTAQSIAASLVETLRPACVRIEIAGSLRRAKAEVGDIEIVCIPITSVFTLDDLFGQPYETVTINHLDETLDALLYGDPWELDPQLKRNGPHYKRLRHIQAGVCCDLFITDPRRWGVIYTIRTGPAAFSQALVSQALQHHTFVDDGLLHGHSRIYKTDEQGKSIPLPCPRGESCSLVVSTPEEIDFFNALGLPFVEPARRSLNVFYAIRPAGRRWD